MPRNGYLEMGFLEMGTQKWVLGMGARDKTPGDVVPRDGCHGWVPGMGFPEMGTQRWVHG